MALALWWLPSAISEGVPMGTAVTLDRSPLALSSDLVALLDFLPVLYPGGHTWLRRALAEVDAGEADAIFAYVDGVLAGVCLGTTKPDDRYKIRTIFVLPRFRRCGVGRALIQRARRAAIDAGAVELYVTAASTLRNDFRPFAEVNGLNHVATAPNRYGVGRHEDVYISSASIQAPGLSCRLD